MKAAVLYDPGGMPQYADLPEPLPQSDAEVLVSVKAVALKHFDKGRARGTHYSAKDHKDYVKIIGSDGVCQTTDGNRVYALGVTGMLAEKALVEKDRIVSIPKGLDDGIAAALPNAVYGSAMALRYRAAVEPGDTVLINGATGFTGRVAIQVAKHYGAKKIIAMGRNQQSLEELPALGADEIISLRQNDEDISKQLEKIHKDSAINVIIDYLWGHTAELILSSLKGSGAFTAYTRFVSVGSVTGDLIQLSAANLRSANLQVTGSGLGSWTKTQVGTLFTEILPEMFQLAAEGKLKIQILNLGLNDIEKCWDLAVPDGKRLVINI